MIMSINQSAFGNIFATLLPELIKLKSKSSHQIRVCDVSTPGNAFPFSGARPK